MNPAAPGGDPERKWASVGRRALNYLAGASLVLLLAAAGTWVWSYRRPVQVVWQTAAKHSWQMDCSDGEVSALRRVGPTPPALGWRVLGQRNRTPSRPALGLVVGMLVSKYQLDW